MAKFNPTFFRQSTVEVAKKLLGTYLVTELPEGRTVGRIVETEAYIKDDPASHAFKGKTARNQTMFGPPGHAYIYFIYGMYWCLNVVTAGEGKGEAVLIRALEPVEGLELMSKRRETSNIYNLCSGPGKLTQAMGISSNLNGVSFFNNSLYLLSNDSYKPQYQPVKPDDIAQTGRIGIIKAKELPLRFFLKDNPFASRKS
jgi:DNA-3-methyladenine glycosylase